MPEGLIKFSYDDVVPGDTVLRLYKDNEGTKREKLVFNRGFHVSDVDYKNRLCLCSYNVPRDFEDYNSYSFYIDRRPRRKRLFSSL